MGLIERIIEKPIELLARTNKPLPNREVLLLYRDYQRFSNKLTWNSHDGTPWSHIIKASIRLDFEASTEETDPFLKSQLLVTWREALNKMHEKFQKAEEALIARINSERT